MDPFAFLLLGLATWRVSFMLVGEDGPGLAFFRLREWTGIKHDEKRHIYMVPERFLPMLLSCVWCTSVWVSAFWVIFWLALPDVAILAAAWFALSTMAIGAHKLLGAPMV